MKIPSRPSFRRKAAWLLLATVAALGLGAAWRLRNPTMGKQDDGAFLVSSGQHIAPGTLSFDGRPMDIALNPKGDFFAVVGPDRVFLARAGGIIVGSEGKLRAGPSYKGAVWGPDGNRLYVSVSNGTIQEFGLEGEKLVPARVLVPKPDGAKGNPRPGGLALTRDGKTLFVAACDRSAVVEIDVASGKWVREWKTQNLPFAVKLIPDESQLLVTDWGGTLPTRAKADGDKEDEKALTYGVQSGDALVVANRNGSAATGTLTIITRATGATRIVAVGLHPTDIALTTGTGKPLAYVANAGSDTVSVLDIGAGKIIKTIPLTGGASRGWGAMPCALALSSDNKTLYAGNGGDNALCEVDTATGKVRGLRPVGYFPVAIALSPDAQEAYVVNTKGNGSVRNTITGKPGKAYDFQGTVSVVDLRADLAAATKQVAQNNHWELGKDALHPPLAVYRGAIKHVLYIIKENRAYDEVFGDLPEGNGDPKLCLLGEKITPNQHALARAFTLFDNGYVSGTNSADGHAWTDQAVANDYLEHIYNGYRTYPDGGDDAMAISTTGGLWDAALKKNKTVRVYGEDSDYDHSYVEPKPKNWLEVYRDRGVGKFKFHTVTRIPSLKPLKHPNFLYWPLLQSDQSRADEFIAEYNRFSKADTVPNLMVMSLPCDHTEGVNEAYPKPKSMIADNDLALGRIIEAVSHSPQWKDTAILVIEDDAQAGLDHVDGHRTVFMAFSPYVRRRQIDSTFYTTVSMLHSIELMLGLDPMNRFDASAPPLASCFTDTPDLAPYKAVPATIPLDDMNPARTTLRGKARYWADQSYALDWSGMDRANPETLNRIVWHSIRGDDSPYPGKARSLNARDND